MRGRFQRSAVTPWAGLAAGAVAWIVHHQLGSDATFWNCENGGPMLTAGLGLACLSLIAIGAALSWSARSLADDANGRPETRRFAVMVSLAGAGLFALAITYQTLAGFIIPGCLA